MRRLRYPDYHHRTPGPTGWRIVDAPPEEMPMEPYYERDGIRVYHGDNREVVPALGEQFAAVVTDPPYGLSKEPDAAEVLRHWLAGDDYRASGGGFMGRSWDGFVPGPATWKVISEAMLPGAHLLAFSGTRTMDLLGMAIRLAGLHNRDTIARLHWIFGSGFPKSLDVSKAIDKINGEPGRELKFTAWMRTTGLSSARINEITGTYMGGHYTTAASQPAVATRAHFEKLRPHITVEIPAWVEELIDRVEAEREVIGNDTKARSTSGKSALPTMGGKTVYESWDITAPATPEAERWQGWGTALKPSHEDILVFRKPLAKGHTVAANVLAHGTGALNIDASRVGTDTITGHGGGKNVEGRTYGNGKGIPAMEAGANPHVGRWPPNTILDPDAARDLDAMSGVSTSQGGKHSGRKGTRDNVGGYGFDRAEINRPTDTGGASRFFTVLPIDDPETLRFRYQAKASRRERTANGAVPNSHPTTKPVALMRWLLTLVTPPNAGPVLDPFAGSGATGVACAELGIPCVLIEAEAEYLPIIAGRIDAALDARSGAALPLFAGVAD